MSLLKVKTLYGEQCQLQAIRFIFSIIRDLLLLEVSALAPKVTIKQARQVMMSIWGGIAMFRAPKLADAHLDWRNRIIGEQQSACTKTSVFG